MTAALQANSITANIPKRVFAYGKDRGEPGDALIAILVENGAWGFHGRGRDKRRRKDREFPPRSRS